MKTLEEQTKAMLALLILSSLLAGVLLFTILANVSLQNQATQAKEEIKKLKEQNEKLLYVQSESSATLSALENASEALRQTRDAIDKFTQILQGSKKR